MYPINFKTLFFGITLNLLGLREKDRRILKDQGVSLVTKNNEVSSIVPIDKL